MKNQSSILYRKQILTGGALVLAATASVFAQQKPFGGPGTAQPPLPPPPSKSANSAAATASSTNAAPAVLTSTNEVEQLFGGKIPDAIAKGKINVNVRLRYEQVDQSSLPDQ